MFCKWIGHKKKLNPKPIILWGRKANGTDFFVADFINSNQIINEINFNGVGMEGRLSEKHRKKTWSS